jgi:hypothetical protein
MAENESSLYTEEAINWINFTEEAIFNFFYFVGWGETDWVHLARRPLLGLLYQPWVIDDNEYRAVGRMRIGRENLPPVPFCPP